MSVVGALPMIKNFEEFKKQINELADLINKFKSEAVQLKIVELIFKGAEIRPDGGETDTESTGTRTITRKKRRKTTASSTSKEQPAKKPPATRAKGRGAKVTLEEFIQAGFFNQKRTIGNVVEHCETSAQNFKANELSGPLRRLVQESKLVRSKNADGQYEYIKK